MRGENLVGQYYAAFPGHAVEPERALEGELRERWLALAERLGVETARLAHAGTRRAFIVSAHETLRKP